MTSPAVRLNPSPLCVLSSSCTTVFWNLLFLSPIWTKGRVDERGSDLVYLVFMLECNASDDWINLSSKLHMWYEHKRRSVGTDLNFMQLTCVSASTWRIYAGICAYIYDTHVRKFGFRRCISKSAREHAQPARTFVCAPAYEDRLQCFKRDPLKLFLSLIEQL